jgi:hypothetical protein
MTLANLKAFAAFASYFAKNTEAHLLGTPVEAAFVTTASA